MLQELGFMTFHFFQPNSIFVIILKHHYSEKKVQTLARKYLHIILRKLEMYRFNQIQDLLMLQLQTGRTGYKE